MYLTKHRLLIAFMVVLLVQLACNMPRGGTPTPSGADAIYTAAAQTVEAQLTQVSQPPATSVGGTVLVPSVTPFPTFTSLPPTSPPAATATQKPTSTPIPCDRVEFVKDVTVPDNTEMSPGEAFVKTWRLKNAGSCTWTTSYALAFANGERMEGPTSVPLTGNVSPGGTVDVSVTLKAPLDPGTYRGNWMLKNGSGALFGLGDGSKPFWVQIKVAGKTGLVYDFLVQAGSAEWTSGVGDEAGTALAYGGDDNDANGVAKIKDTTKLETGLISGKILLTFPKRQDNGYVSGLFPEYKVQSGDRLKATLGFMIPEGSSSCGSGKVKFQLLYKEGDTVKSFKEWTKSCNGSLLPIDVDLNDLKGKTVRFILTVRADGSFSDDWAIWNSLRIVN